MTRGHHQNSLANLQPRTKTYGEDKKRRTLSVTEAGWEGAMQAIEAAGCNSISEFLERLGRGQIKVST